MLQFHPWSVCDFFFSTRRLLLYRITIKAHFVVIQVFLLHCCDNFRNSSLNYQNSVADQHSLQLVVRQEMAPVFWEPADQTEHKVSSVEGQILALMQKRVDPGRSFNTTCLHKGNWMPTTPYKGRIKSLCAAKTKVDAKQADQEGQFQRVHLSKQSIKLYSRWNLCWPKQLQWVVVG